jgi:type IV pilus secretin PilQ/predicted competence protein
MKIIRGGTMRNIRNFTILILIVLIIVPLYFACSSSNKTATKTATSYIDNIKTKEINDGTLVEIYGRDIAHYNTFQLHDKKKIIIDIPETNIDKVFEPGTINTGCVQGIHIYQFAEADKKLARVEINLTQDIQPKFNDNSDLISVELDHGVVDQSNYTNSEPEIASVSTENTSELATNENSSSSKNDKVADVPLKIEEPVVDTESIIKSSNNNKNSNIVDQSTNKNASGIDTKTPHTNTESKSSKEQDTKAINSKINNREDKQSSPDNKQGVGKTEGKTGKADLQESNSSNNSNDSETTKSNQTAVPEVKTDETDKAPSEAKDVNVSKDQTEVKGPEFDGTESLKDDNVQEMLKALDANETNLTPAPKESDIPLTIKEPLTDVIPDVPVSWYLRDAGLREFLRLVAKEYNFNLVIDPDVAAKITVHLDKVPLPTALTTVLNSYGFGIELRDTIVRVGNLERLSKEKERDALMKQNMKMAVDLKKESRSLNYASSKDLKPIVEKLLTKNRQDAFAAVDERTNTLLVYDTPENLKVIWDWVEKLDRATKQVFIQARIVQTTNKFARSLGIQWGGTYIADASHGNALGYRFPNSMTLAGATGSNVLSGTDNNSIPAAVNLPISDINSGIGILLGDTLDTIKLDIALSASESDNDTKILSTPRVTTSDNVAGSIKFGQEYPYQTRDQNGALVTEFKETVTSIKVTPHTTNDFFIKMNIEVTKDSFAGFTPQGIVYLNKNEAKMEVYVKDGDTAVIGGLNTSNVSNTLERVPLLGKIPILGWLFKKQVKTNEKDDILIFLTPYIVK